MKKAKKLTALFLTGSLALCTVSANTNAGFFSRFLNSKYGGLAIGSTLVSIAALTKFYTQDQNVQGGILSSMPFYLKAFGNTVTLVAKASPFFILPAASLLLGKRITKIIKKSPITQYISAALPLIGVLGLLLFGGGSSTQQGAS